MPDVADDPVVEPDQGGEQEGPVDRSASRPEFTSAYLGPTAAAPSMDGWGKGSVDFNSLDPDPQGLWVLVGPSPERIHGTTNIGDQGPGPVAGEITDIAIDPSGPTDQIIYVATNNGGVWKSTDGGTTFKPKMDFMMSLSMGAIALDHGNSQIVYAGSGNLFDGGHQFQRNAGIYKSCDGGETWAIADGGFFATALVQTAINRIVSAGPDQLLVATLKGLYYSIDGALNFGANPPNYDDGEPIRKRNITSLIADTASPTTTFYCAVEPNTLLTPPEPGGIFTITIDPSKTVTVSATSLFVTSHITQFNDIALAMGPDQSLYASVQFNSIGPAPALKITPTYVGLFRKKSGQNNWTRLPNAKIRADSDGAGQTNYDLTIGVDPQDKNRLYLGFQELWLSTDGGSTFGAPAISKNKIHYDHHAMVFSPATHQAGGAPTTIYVGEDGGLARSTDGGVHWDNLNETFATSLFYGFDIGRGSAANNAYSYGGMQDTGTAVHRPGDTGLEWHCSIDGDGGRVAVDPANPQIVYGFDNQYLIKSPDGGNTWREARLGQIANGLPQTDGAVRRIALDPNGSDPAKRTVYVNVNDVLYKSTNAGIQFVKVPPNAGWGKGREILCIAIAPQDSKRIWLGLIDGTVHYSADAGKTWDAGSFNTAPRVPPTSFFANPCSDIAVDPAKVDRVAAVYLGESELSGVISTQHCFLTTDNGNSWSDITGKNRLDPAGNIPDLPVRSVVFDKSVSPSRILVAADGGVMATDDLGGTWRRYGVGLPVTPCMKLAIDDTTGLLRAATYGRSAWEFTQPSGKVLYVDANLAFDPAAAGQIRALTLGLCNPGDQDLSVSAINLASGSSDFKVDPATVFPIQVAKKTAKKVTIRFSPSSAGILTATFQIVSDAPGSPATVPASGLGVAVGKVGPRLAVSANLGFGEVKTGDTSVLKIVIQNTGAMDLTVSDFKRIDGSTDFDVIAPSLPDTIKVGEIRDTYKVQFKPSSSGPLRASFQITSNASRSTAVIDATGTGISSSSLGWIILGIALGAVVVGVVVYEATK